VPWGKSGLKRGVLGGNLAEEENVSEPEKGTRQVWSGRKGRFLQKSGETIPARKAGGIIRGML
jgi:hypothetical protein